jgi:ectoine hydroxylase-related dioxygenase (phytanoyl-CoA dioxygenase family)
MAELEDRRAHLERIEHDGYTILEGVLEPAQADALAADLRRLEGKLGIVPSTNIFEGFKTTRIYNLLVHGKLYEEIPVHPAVLPLVEGVLDPGCLVSSLSSISIAPGEAPQRLVPGSHRSDHAPALGQAYDTIAAVMPKGSVFVYNGSLWHGGGANRTDAPRVGIAMNYCAGWLRQQENQQLGIPREIARGFCPRLRELVGYGVYNFLIGHIDKRSPVELLGEEGDLRTVWELLPGPAPEGKE